MEDNKAQADYEMRRAAAYDGLVRAAKRGLSSVENELLPLHAKMSVLSPDSVKIYEESPVYQGLIAERDAFRAALAVIAIDEAK